MAQRLAALRHAPAEPRMLKEFKEFAMRGNVVDLAIGVIIGAAFGKIVDSLVNDIIMPIIGAITGGLDFSNYFVGLSHAVNAPALADAKKQGAVLAYGNFITVFVNFVIIAFVLLEIFQPMLVLEMVNGIFRWSIGLVFVGWLVMALVCRGGRKTPPPASPGPKTPPPVVPPTPPIPEPVPPTPTEKILEHEDRLTADGYRKQLETNYSLKLPPDQVTPFIDARFNIKGSAEYQRWLRAFVSSGQMIYREPVVHEIPLITQPTLFIMGADDHNAPGRPNAPEALRPKMGHNAELAQALATRMPNARAEVIPDTGHLVFLEAPQKYDELVLDFLSK